MEKKEYNLFHYYLLDKEEFENLKLDIAFGIDREEFLDKLLNISTKFISLPIFNDDTDDVIFAQIPIIEQKANRFQAKADAMYEDVHRYIKSVNFCNKCNDYYELAFWYKQGILLTKMYLSIVKEEIKA